MEEKDQTVGIEKECQEIGLHGNGQKENPKRIREGHELQAQRKRGATKQAR